MHVYEKLLLFDDVNVDDVMLMLDGKYGDFANRCHLDQLCWCISCLKGWKVFHMKYYSVGRLSFDWNVCIDFQRLIRFMSHTIFSSLHINKRTQTHSVSGAP